MRRLALGLVVLLVLLFGAGRWLASPGGAPDQNASRGPVGTPENSDYYMKNATIYQLNPDGRLAYRAQAAEALHFVDGSARFNDVDLHYVDTANSFWDVHAAHGHVPANAQHSLYLYDGVTGRHPRDKGRVLRFVTDHAWIYPDRNLVVSDAPVKAYEPGQTVTGSGLRVNLDTSTLNLLHNVHVTYAP